MGDDNLQGVTEEGVSLGEIVRRLSRIETKLDTKVVQSDLYDSEKHAAIESRQVLATRIDRLEEGRSWLIRTVGFAVIGMIVEAIVLAFTLGQ